MILNHNRQRSIKILSPMIIIIIFFIIIIKFSAETGS